MLDDISGLRPYFTVSEDKLMQVQRQILEIKDRRVVIELPESFVNHRVEFIALTVDEEVPAPAKKLRSPHPDIAGKGKTLGDIVGPLVDASDWECLK